LEIRKQRQAALRREILPLERLNEIASVDLGKLDEVFKHLAWSAPPTWFPPSQVVLQIPYHVGQLAGIADGVVLVAVIEHDEGLAGAPGHLIYFGQPLKELLLAIEILKALSRSDALLKPVVLVAAMKANVGDVSGSFSYGGHGGAIKLGLIHTDKGQTLFFKKAQSLLKVLLIHPPAVAKLYGQRIVGKHLLALLKVVQTFRARHKEGGKLKQHYPQLATLLEGHKGLGKHLKGQISDLSRRIFKQAQHPFFGRKHLFEQAGQSGHLHAMLGQKAKGLDVKDKVRRGPLGPQLGVTPGRKGIEGGIHLYRIKVLGIELKPVLSAFEARGIESLAL
jgi:hypothetical protein